MTPRISLLTLSLTLIASAADLENQAYAILKKNCFVCHGASKMSGLDLRTRESMLAGGERGPAVEPTNPRRSLLFQFIAPPSERGPRGAAAASGEPAPPRMPPTGRLSDDDIRIIERWIEGGALLDSVAEARPASERQRMAELAKLEDRAITPEERKYWAFQKPKKIEPARAARAEWNGNPIDRFLFASMQAKGLQPSPRADRRTLIRRAYLDLIGLPPTPEEIDAFVKDDSADSWAKLIEKLLASPHYGERWARHWLDLARFADSGGFERDFDWPNAWRFRDYVADSLNRDKPYDRFIREQLAGDEFWPDSQEARIATGFLRLGMDNNIKTERTRMDEMDDLVVTTSLSFLGMTVGCARCHNHKFDPIPQKDYYQMVSVFFSTKNIDYALVPPDAVAAHRAEMSRIIRLQAPLRKAQDALEEPHRKRLFEEKLNSLPEYMQVAWRTPTEKRTDGQRLNARQIEQTLKIEDKQVLAVMTAEEKQKHLELGKQIRALDVQRPKPYASAMVIGEGGRDPLPSYFLHRGSLDMKGSRMSPGVLSAAWDGPYDYPEPPPESKTTWRRKGLADWIASPENPLTARVMVNRIWQHHFGEGIVRTPSNFGKTGQPPSHPELLDWLAVEFMERGWSIKQMHRLMMTSNAYQMSSDDIPANLKIDSENRAFWRMPRRRLEAEIIRDQILAVAGTLDRTTGGPAVFPHIDPDLFQSSTERTWPGKSDEDPSTWRRSIYVFSKRSIRYPMFETFDQPDMVNSCDRRNRSTIAPQALLLMNNGFMMLQAKKFAERLEKEAGASVDAKIERAYRLALGRPPDDVERSESAGFIRKRSTGLVDFCQALLTLNEFVYRQ